MDAAIAELRTNGAGEIPAYLRDAHYTGAAKLGRGLTYKYPHPYPGHWVEQQYLPDSVADAQFYTPSDNKYEQSAAEY